MAKITTVSVTYERKVNLGDYNSAHIGISIWAELEEGDDPKAITEQLYEDAKGHVKAQTLPVVANHRAEVEKTFLGLPVEVQNQIMEGYTNGH